MRLKNIGLIMLGVCCLIPWAFAEQKVRFYNESTVNSSKFIYSPVADQPYERYYATENGWVGIPLDPKLKASKALEILRVVDNSNRAASFACETSSGPSLKMGIGGELFQFDSSRGLIDSIPGYANVLKVQNEKGGYIYLLQKGAGPLADGWRTKCETIEKESAKPMKGTREDCKDRHLKLAKEIKFTGDSKDAAIYEVQTHLDHRLLRTYECTTKIQRCTTQLPQIKTEVSVRKIAVRLGGFNSDRLIDDYGSFSNRCKTGKDIGEDCLLKNFLAGNGEADAKMDKNPLSEDEKRKYIDIQNAMADYQILRSCCEDKECQQLLTEQVKSRKGLRNGDSGSGAGGTPNATEVQ